MIASNVLLRNLVRGWNGYSRLMEGMAVYYWPKVIGPAFSGKTAAEKAMAGTLWVRTEEPTIAHQLSFFIPRILKSYRDILGDGIVKSVRFTVGQIPTLEVEENVFNVMEEGMPVVLPDFVKDSAGVIGDEQLQAAFLRLAEGSYRQRSHLQGMGWRECSCGVMTADGGLCADCLRKEWDEQRDALTFFISKYPHLTYEEAHLNLPGTNQDDWNKIREHLRQIVEDQIVLLAKEIRRTKKTKELNQMIGPCMRYLKLGGEEKTLIFILGTDVWNGLQTMKNDNIKDSAN